MNYLFSLHTPMQSIFLARGNSILKRALLTLAGVFLLAFASQLSIPLQPVPLTFQSATVILIGMAFGARQGAAVIAAYLAAGALGAPVFAGFSFGPATFAGPTGGYLIGFLPAAYISGYIAEKGWAKNVISSFAAALLGASVIFICGIAMLSTFVGLQTAIAVGLMPFAVTEIIKLAAVSLLIPRLWKRDN